MVLNYLLKNLLKKKYPYVELSKNGKPYRVTVHRLVAKAFLPCEDSNILQVNHKDGNKLNNRVDNLEWATLEENLAHAYQNNLIHLSKLSKEEVLDILKLAEDFVRDTSEKYGIKKESVRYILQSPGMMYRKFTR